jgi:hypothetical protein
MDYPWLQKNSDREKILNHYRWSVKVSSWAWVPLPRPLAQRISSAITSRIVPAVQRAVLLR